MTPLNFVLSRDFADSWLTKGGRPLTLAEVKGEASADAERGWSWEWSLRLVVFNFGNWGIVKRVGEKAPPEKEKRTKRKRVQKEYIIILIYKKSDVAPKYKTLDNLNSLHTI